VKASLDTNASHHDDNDLDDTIKTFSITDLQSKKSLSDQDDCNCNFCVHVKKKTTGLT
jgi:hypothetical protein